MEEDNPIYNTLAREYNARWQEENPDVDVPIPDYPFWIPCVHGLSAWLCDDPINHYPRDVPDYF